MTIELQRWVPSNTIPDINAQLRRRVEVLDKSARAQAVSMITSGTMPLEFPTSTVVADTVIGALALTLPDAATVPGYTVTVVRSGTSRVTVTDGSTTWGLEQSGDSATFVSNGAGWALIARGSLTNGWTAVVAPTDQSVINSATLTDSALTFPVRANTTYRVRLMALFDTTAAGDLKVDVNGPGSPTRVRLVTDTIVAGGASLTDTRIETAFGVSRTIAGGTDAASYRAEGIITNGANAGAVTLRFAQNSATNDTGAILRAGSFVEWAPV